MAGAGRVGEERPIGESGKPGDRRSTTDARKIGDKQHVEDASKSGDQQPISDAGNVGEPRPIADVGSVGDPPSIERAGRVGDLRSTAHAGTAGDPQRILDADKFGDQQPIADDGKVGDRPRIADADGVGDRQPIASGPGELLQAWLCLVPALALAWPGPGAILRDDFVPQSTGAGAAALLAIPAAACLVLRGATPAARGLTLFLVPLLIAVGWTSFGSAADTFEASRALLTAFTGLVLFLCGASLGAYGRQILARGAVCIALLLLVPALCDSENGFSGLLGNTGSVSEAALAGAIAGAIFVATDAIGWKIAGASAAVLHAAYVARVPVVAGALALAFALGAAALLARSLARGWRIGLAAAACAVALTPIVAIAARSAERTRAAHEIAAGAETPPHESAPNPGDTGGFEVRARIWRSSLSMLGQHALSGVGPGQFAAAFPAYRDPREIELTTLSRRVPGETEVEHPHNDWLLTALDTGVIGGLCWIAFLVTVLARGARALRGGDASLLPVAAAAIGLAANSFVNATLSGDAVSSTLAFAMFGCAVAEKGSPRSAIARRFVALGAAALLLVHSPRAFALVRHGRALHPLAAELTPDPDAQTRILERALDACPDSVLALRLHARRMEAEHRDPALIHAEWLRVLSARPQHVEALMQLGFLAATAGQPARARPYYAAALALDANHPGVLQNLTVLEFESGDIDAGLEYLERLSRIRPPGDEWLTDLASRLYLRGRERESEVLMVRVHRELNTLRAEEAHALAKSERQRDHALLADALESHAQRTWAREHMQAERFKDAVRLYRQDLRITRDYVEGGAPRLRLELAAALLASGRIDEAKSEVEGVHPEAADWNELPAFARDRLRATGWFPP